MNFILFILFFPLEWALKKGCIMIYNDRNCFFFFQAPKKLMNVPTTVCLSKLHPCYDIVSLTYFKKLFSFYHKMDLVFEFAIRPMLKPFDQSNATHKLVCFNISIKTVKHSNCLTIVIY